MIADVSHFVAVREALAGTGIEVVAGADAIAESVADTEIDIVVTALVGYSGLAPTIRAINAGKKIALANKETLVVAGELITGMLKDSVSELIPVDSEHSAIFQCLVGEDVESVEKLILTASGGPFRTMSVAEMSKVTKADALNHPNWKMGAKVTVDSASMMNKGFEMIEARWLFNIVPDRIEIVVHPQSIVHSMIESPDGAVYALLSVPDMTLPIVSAITGEQSSAKLVRPLDFSSLSLTFEDWDRKRFPMLGLGYRALELGRSYPIAFAAADEKAVDAFLSRRIGFMDIPKVTEKVLDAGWDTEPSSLEIILEMADKAGIKAEEAICSFT